MAATWAEHQEERHTQPGTFDAATSAVVILPSRGPRWRCIFRNRPSESWETTAAPAVRGGACQPCAALAVRGDAQGHGAVPVPHHGRAPRQSESHAGWGIAYASAAELGHALNNNTAYAGVPDTRSAIHLSGRWPCASRAQARPRSDLPPACARAARRPGFPIVCGEAHNRDSDHHHDRDSRAFSPHALTLTWRAAHWGPNGGGDSDSRGP